MSGVKGFAQAVVASIAASWLIGAFTRTRPPLEQSPTVLPPPKLESRWGK